MAGVTRPAPVLVEACQGCGACLLTCPTHAIRPVPGGLVVRADRCTGCLECLEICPVGAIRAAGPRHLEEPMATTPLSAVPVREDG
ncbi:4Fe-4S binding protein [Salinispora arenicola]|uniref:4Fe-4S ferredoxin-type domain-containing protein n=2 Tax=Salinispora arenicola TaxID=168697 RepID=A0ABQ4JQ12_SALAC|nr:4Fe-4S binding protein [Salinispora arenicola]MCN0151010.1 4Fe-4S binding protein [Salinispora arenicola]NIL58579.1 4Fe-4S binding protein [Salinispora arenicola]NIL60969.1 4Fe-4S binding protein [Salinispora arenicola]GIM84568.1 hypothetical protein Sar04_18010 [Salinispora arenicola]